MKKKILVVTGCDERQEGFAKYTFENNKMYCLKHNYDFKAYTGKDFFFALGDYFKSSYRAPNWAKVAIVIHNINKYDYILWLDADAFIVNHKKRIEDVFNLKDDNFVIKLAPDVEFLNVGVFLINCKHPLTHQLFQKWSEMGLQSNEHLQTSFVSKLRINQFEQGAFMELYYNNWNNIMPYVRILESQIINSHLQTEFWRTPYQPYHQYKRGKSFILHLAGIPIEKRIDLWHTFISKEVIK